MPYADDGSNVARPEMADDTLVARRLLSVRHRSGLRTADVHAPAPWHRRRRVTTGLQRDRRARRESIRRSDRLKRPRRNTRRHLGRRMESQDERRPATSRLRLRAANVAQVRYDAVGRPHTRPRPGHPTIHRRRRSQRRQTARSLGTCAASSPTAATGDEAAARDRSGRGPTRSGEPPPVGQSGCGSVARRPLRRGHR